MLIYRLTTSFAPQMTSAHYRFPFIIDKDGGALRLKYSYSPKRLEDTACARKLIAECYAGYGFAASEEEVDAELPLNNLITLSLDSPRGLVGSAHRHASQAEYYVSEGEASPGFAKTRIAKGEWAVVLSAHAVLSDRVDAEVEVYVD